MTKKLNKLNCMNYHCQDSEGDQWYMQCGLRSLFNMSKRLNLSFKEVCNELYNEGQIVVTCPNSTKLIVTMI